jgi:hypothetical protein
MLSEVLTTNMTALLRLRGTSWRVRVGTTGPTGHGVYRSDGTALRASAVNWSLTGNGSLTRRQPAVTVPRYYEGVHAPSACMLPHPSGVVWMDWAAGKLSEPEQAG